MQLTNEVKIIIGISVITLILVVGAAFLFGGNSSSSSAQNAQPIKNVSALVRPNSAELNNHSKVTLVEFGDFQCPACGAEYPVVTQILQNYKGKINYVFRNFPLPQHQNAAEAAEAAEAAKAQGKFFDMFNLLYQNQNTWSDVSDPTSYFVTYAKALHLDLKQFQSDVKSKKYAKVIQQDIDDGYAVGVNATPTFYLNGVPMVGVLPYSDFQKAIDKDLQQADSKK
ncbi:MAG TPA: thioredoxin domain-containing protein [Candidatus Saccharimonadales bacterium]|nr:thioredoxin domain-containing protein [Candidatus Saccharimonadales bacterium]